MTEVDFFKRLMKVSAPQEMTMGKAANKITDGLHEAIGLSRAYGVLDRWLNPDHIRLHAGEMTAQEMRTVLAVLRAVRAELGSP